MDQFEPHNFRQFSTEQSIVCEFLFRGSQHSYVSTTGSDKAWYLLTLFLFLLTVMYMCSWSCAGCLYAQTLFVFL